MKRFSLALLLVLLVACNNTEIDYEKLNAQAAEEYNTAIRPGYEGRNPYWNEFAVKFIYAPAFDFKEVEQPITNIPSHQKTTPNRNRGL